MYGSGGGYFQKYDKNGNRIWEENMLLWILAKPQIGADDVIYLGSEDGNFNAWNKDGTKKWQVMLGASVYGSAAIGPGGTLYVGTYVPANSHGIFFAISPTDGSVLWKHETTGMMKSSAATNPKTGHVYIGNYDGSLYAYDGKNGTVLWTHALWGPAEASPAVGPDGTIYIGGGITQSTCPTTGCFFYAINPDGSLKWQYKVGGTVLNAPTIGADGTIYAGCNDKFVYAFNPSGTLRWKYETGGQVLSGPAIGLDGTVFAGSQDDSLHAVYRPCHPGHYCPVSISVPTACKIGTYNNSTRAVTPVECAACPAGHLCAQLATTLPAPCPAGSYCPAGASIATPCKPGTFNKSPLGTSVASCAACTAGYECAKASTTAPVACPAGTYCHEGSSVTQPCPLGHYCPEKSAAPQACAANTYTPATKATTCVACPKGYKCTNGQLDSGAGLSHGEVIAIVAGVSALTLVAGIIMGMWYQRRRAAGDGFVPRIDSLVYDPEQNLLDSGSEIYSADGSFNSDDPSAKIKLKHQRQGFQ